MGLLGDIGGDIGAIGGALSGGGADDEAKQYYRMLMQQMGRVNPNIAAQTIGPSALGGAGLEAKAAQQDALRQFQNTYRQGGLDAATRAGLAEATTATNRAAQARTNAIQAKMRAQGGGRSGVSLALQQQAGQQGDQNANQQAMDAAAVAQGNRQAATAGAAGAATSIRGQDYQAAGAADAVNQFNAQMRQNAAQQTYGNSMDQLGREGNAYGGVYNAGKASEARIARLYGSIGKTVGTAGDAIAGMPPGGADTSYGGGPWADEAD